MITKDVLKSEKIEGLVLRQIEVSDCNVEYVNWLNDIEVNRFLETKWRTQTIETIRQFVEQQRGNDNSILWAIIFKERHIGNIKIGPINWHHSHADISYFIGEKEFWGRGIASESIKLVTSYGFEVLGIHKIEAGTYADAIGSQRALKRNGFLLEGIQKDHICLDGEFQDEFRFGKVCTK